MGYAKVIQGWQARKGMHPSQALLGKQVLRRGENLVWTALLNNLEAEQERDIYIILKVKN